MARWGGFFSSYHNPRMRGFRFRDRACRNSQNPWGWGASYGWWTKGIKSWNCQGTSPNCWHSRKKISTSISSLSIKTCSRGAIRKCQGLILKSHSITYLSKRVWLQKSSPNSIFVQYPKLKKKSINLFKRDSLGGQGIQPESQTLSLYRRKMDNFASV